MTATHDARLILQAQPLGPGPMPGIDPFIFGAYHQDRYPRGNGALGPDPALLAGRPLGSDFTGKDGWSMYHGEAAPGFPAHPHRGFETVTIVRKGLVDHADSLGATARYGQGDVQWLTTGSGVQHGEMFPLVNEGGDNTLDLFQIWLNLPAKRKMAPPAFKMFWAADIPHVTLTDAEGRRAEVEVVAGDFTPVGGGETIRALPPPEASWASEPDAEVAIWIIRLEPGATMTLPPASPAARRVLYLTTGEALIVGAHRFDHRVVAELASAEAAPLANPGAEAIELLLLQGRPIGEPVAARGPFVMNSQSELMQAIRDYQATEFGGWPWPTREHMLGDAPRFAQHPDGRIEHPPG